MYLNCVHYNDCCYFVCSLGHQYFIPVSILVPQDYPRSAPHAYIKPTPDMELVKSDMVNQYGRVEIDFLKQWNRVSLYNITVE